MLLWAGTAIANAQEFKQDTVQLQEVEIVQRQSSTITSRFTPIQTQRITYAELCRAACCNLAESFETNPSVDVAYTDAATGAKQIRLLGLAGTYVQMLTENFPNFRGVAAPYGLDYVPGPWLESIYVSKGTSSVKNGHEALTGQINVEFKKPKADADILSVNVFAADNMRYEANADATVVFNPALSSMILAHFSSEEKEFDMNGDGFLDTPLKRQVNLMNRWEYKSGRYIGQYGLRFMNENRRGGQRSGAVVFPDSLYTIHLETNRIEGFAKNGFILNPENNESVALIVSGSSHEQQSRYGIRLYNVQESNLYASWMYERNFTGKHALSAGISLNYDRQDENYTLNRGGLHENTLIDETTGGIYGQYTFNHDNEWIVLAGIRVDYSDLYQFFVTPRIHVKYNLTDWLMIRASAGKGFRSAQALPEYNYYLAGSRKIVMENRSCQEEAWNYGTNLDFRIPVAGKELTLNAEWYYTNFINQLVVDVDSDPHAVSFYKLDGVSYSSTFQVEATYPFFRGFSLTAAYRKSKVKTDYQGKLLDKPFNNDYKTLVTASYQTPLRKWQWDATAQFNGGGRLPVPDVANPLWDTRFDPFTIVNVQMTKFFRIWSVYAGAENLLDFVQKQSVIDPQHPWGNDFDTSIVWGPLHGRKLYVGLRWNVPRY